MLHGARSLHIALLAALVLVALAQPAFPVARTSLGELFSGSG
jgi:hypothetical protein